MLVRFGERGAGAEIAQARPGLRRARRPRRRHGLRQVGPVRQRGRGRGGEHEARRKRGDQALRQFELRGQQAVGRAGAEHRRLEVFELGRRFAACARIDADLGLRELPHFGVGVDAVEHAPARQVDRAVAHVHPFDLLREAAQRAHEQQRQLRLGRIGALCALDEEIDRARVGVARPASSSRAARSTSGFPGSATGATRRSNPSTACAGAAAPRRRASAAAGCGPRA